MAIVVRPLGADEGRVYLEIVNRAIRGLASGHYDADAIAGWVVPLTDETLHDFAANLDHEVRLIAEVDGQAAGIGALVVEGSELRACYVAPEYARRGVGSALVAEIERRARAHGLARLTLSASLNAEPFYTRLGYRVTDRRSIVLRSGQWLAAVVMEKTLEDVVARGRIELPTP